MKKIGWILLGILAGLIWIGVCYAEQPTSANTISLIVDSDNDYEADVQQFMLQALRQKGYNVILSEGKNKNSPDKILEVKVKKISGRTDYGSNYTPNYIPSIPIKIGRTSTHLDLNSSSHKDITTHYDKMSATMILWQGNKAVSSSCSVVPVVWRKANTNYHNSSKRQSEEGLLVQGALIASARAFSQLALSSPPPSQLKYNCEYGDGDSAGSTDADLIVVYLLKKDGNLVWCRVGKAKTLEGAYQDALKAERKILPPKK